MSELKAGDKVRLIDAGGFRSDGLKVGNVYTVSDASRETLHLAEYGHLFLFSVEQFEKVTELKTGDRVRWAGLEWTVENPIRFNGACYIARDGENAWVLIERLEVVRPAYRLEASAHNEIRRYWRIYRADGTVATEHYDHLGEHEARVCLAALLADHERREREEAERNLIKNVGRRGG